MIYYEKEHYRQDLILHAIAGCAKNHDSTSLYKDNPKETAHRAVAIADEVIKILYEIEINELEAKQIEPPHR
jgi:hypothetical protein